MYRKLMASAENPPEKTKDEKMKFNTEPTEITIKQRMSMLPNPPADPVSGRGCQRVELTDAPDVVDFVMSNPHPHFAAVCVRRAVNRFGKLGTPKVVFCSPEMAELFK